MWRRRLGFLPTFEVGEPDQELKFIRLHVVKGPGSVYPAPGEPGAEGTQPPPPAGADGGNDAADLRDRVFSPLLLARSNAIAECEVEGCDARVDARRSQFCVRHLGKCMELW